MCDISANFGCNTTFLGTEQIICIESNAGYKTILYFLATHQVLDKAYNANDERLISICRLWFVYHINPFVAGVNKIAPRGSTTWHPKSPRLLIISCMYPLGVVTEIFPIGGTANLGFCYFRQGLVKSRSCEIVFQNNPIALKCDRWHGSTAAEPPVKFQSDWRTWNINLAPSILHDVLG